MTIKIQIRRATLAAFMSASVVLAMGEPAYTTDGKQYYIGDGVTEFGDLTPYANKAELNQAITDINQHIANQVNLVTEYINAQNALQNTRIDEVQAKNNEQNIALIALDARILSIESIPPLTVIDGGTA